MRIRNVVPGMRGRQKDAGELVGGLFTSGSGRRVMEDWGRSWIRRVALDTQKEQLQLA